jgi:hypothetical protein
MFRTESSPMLASCLPERNVWIIFASEGPFIPAKSGKGGGLRLREDQVTVDNQPPSVDESK